MMRDNSAARKLVLVLALMAMVGVSVGCACEDPFLAGASYADDPAAPAPDGSLAMLAPAEPLFAPIQSMDMSGASEAPGTRLLPGPSCVVRFPHLPSSALDLPRRC